MRATAMGLAAVVLALVGSTAHADPGFTPPQTYVPAYPACYGSGPCPNSYYGPTFCFQGPCLPPYPYNGALAFPRRSPPSGPGGGPGYGGPAGPAVFATHPFARSPRDFFMYCQEWTD